MPYRDQHFHIRPEHPDFLDLPWHLALEEWSSTNRLVEVEHAPSRHPVVFVEYSGVIYAIKEFPDERLARHEYELLRALSKKDLPSVHAVGFVRTHQKDHDSPRRSVLITEYLDTSLPFRSLFVYRGMERYRERLQNAMACLLVRLHLAGFYWGDCSLNNVLFKRDAGELGAYVVDVETSRLYDQLEDNSREGDLDIMYENVYGDLCDVCAEHPPLASQIEPEKFVDHIRQQYDWLWNEITKEVLISKDERYKIHERLETLNQMGFSVDEIQMDELGEKVKLRTIVTDQSYHRHHLHNLTGIVAKDNEARLMLNEIKSLKASISQRTNRSIPISVAAFQWVNDIYYPAVSKITSTTKLETEEPELYCTVLEHKWYLSEQAGRDVGLSKAIDDYAEKFRDVQSPYDKETE